MDKAKLKQNATMLKIIWPIRNFGNWSWKSSNMFYLFFLKNKYLLITSAQINNLQKIFLFSPDNFYDTIELLTSASKTSAILSSWLKSNLQAMHYLASVNIILFLVRHLVWIKTLFNDLSQLYYKKYNADKHIFIWKNNVNKQICSLKHCAKYK
jgi:hypothetical protein